MLYDRSVLKSVAVILLAGGVALMQGCGVPLNSAAASSGEPAQEAALPLKASQLPESQSPAESSASAEAAAQEAAAQDDEARSSAEEQLASTKAVKLPEGGSSQPAPADSQDNALGDPSGSISRDLVGSCRLYFADDSVRCREIYGSSRARFIEIFIKHCQTGAEDYDGVWSAQSCPLVLADKERVGGCLADDPDYSTIAYSYIDPNDALAKGMVPLVRTRCLGTYIPER